MSGASVRERRGVELVEEVEGGEHREREDRFAPGVVLEPPAQGPERTLG